MFNKIQAIALGLFLTALPLWVSTVLAPSVGLVVVSVGHLAGCILVSRIVYIWIQAKDPLAESFLEGARLAMKQDIDSIRMLAKFKMRKREVQYTITAELTKAVDEHGNTVYLPDETSDGWSDEEGTDKSTPRDV